MLLLICPQSNKNDVLSRGRGSIKKGCKILDMLGSEKITQLLYRKHQTNKIENKIMKQFLLLLLLPLFYLTLNTSVYASNAQLEANKAVVTKHVFGVHGLSCPFCAIGIKKTFKKVKGVKSVDVSLKNGTVTVYTRNGVCFSKKELEALFAKTGFSYHGTMVKPKSCK